jgi:hypothetical protein
LYADIQDGRLRAVKNGRSTRILVDDLKRYLAGLPAIEPKAEAATLETRATVGGPGGAGDVGAEMVPSNNLGGKRFGTGQTAKCRAPIAEVPTK